MRKPFALILILLLTASASASHRSRKKEAAYEAEIRKTLAAFIMAFDNLDWDRFRAAFDDGATVFYPRGFPNRATGRAEIEKNFRVVFQQIKGDQTAPPYMQIDPRDLDIKIFGTTAIATFHLDDPGFVNRRTIVLVRGQKGWKIVHLHASEVEIPK